MVCAAPDPKRKAARVTRRKDLPPELADVFRVASARASGVPARRLDASDLDAPFRGVRVRRAPPPPGLRRYEQLDYDLRRLAAGYLPVAPADAAFSHATAARLLRMPVPDRLLTPELHVSTAGTAPRRRGVIGHQLQRDAHRFADGLPVIASERVWLQLAPLLSLDELIVAGDYLVRRKQPISSLALLQRELSNSPGHRGLASARTAFGQLRAGTDSPPESWMRLIIVRAGFPEPIVGCRVHHDHAFIGTPDLAYPEYRIAFEYQGEGHREQSEFENDIFRLEQFHEARWTVIQVTRRLLWQQGWLAERTRRALITQGWTPSPQ